MRTLGQWTAMILGSAVACWFLDGWAAMTFTHYLDPWQWWEPFLTLASLVFFGGFTLIAVVGLALIPDLRLGRIIVGGVLSSTHLFSAGFRYAVDAHPVRIVTVLFALAITIWVTWYAVDMIRRERIAEEKRAKDEHERGVRFLQHLKDRIAERREERERE